MVKTETWDYPLKILADLRTVLKACLDAHISISIKTAQLIAFFAGVLGYYCPGLIISLLSVVAVVAI